MSLIALRRRTLTSLVAAVQLALPVALSVAHATASSELGAPAHVEETSGSKCSAVHIDECIVCRHLSTSAAKSPGPLSIVARSAIAQPGAAGALAARSLSPHAFQSRAPPDLSA
jgi:hypothetical protein